MYLYPIESALMALFDAIDAGEITQEDAADTLEGLVGDYESAIDDICTKIKALKADAAAISAEIKSLTERKEKKEAQAERYLYLAEESLRRMDKPFFESPRSRVAFRKNPPRVVIDDENEFVSWAKAASPELVKVNSTYSPNKEEIKRRLALGVYIPGAHMEQKESITIK